MNRTITTFFGLWLLAATALSASGLLERAPMPAPQILLVALTAMLLALCLRSSERRAWVEALPLQVLVLLHASRFVGIYFIILYACGRLPYEFAVPAGLGDICVASTALIVGTLPLRTRSGPILYAAWNVFGLLDILFVVVNAGRLGMMNPESIAPLTRLPGSLLPTFLVPIIIAAHVILALRLKPLLFKPAATGAKVA